MYAAITQLVGDEFFNWLKENKPLFNERHTPEEAAKQLPPQAMQSLLQRWSPNDAATIGMVILKFADGQSGKGLRDRKVCQEWQGPIGKYTWLYDSITAVCYGLGKWGEWRLTSLGPTRGR